VSVVAKPPEAMVATAVFELVQVAVEVQFTTELSE
jgi:hypothetical protein